MLYIAVISSQFTTAGPGTVLDSRNVQAALFHPCWVFPGLYGAIQPAQVIQHGPTKPKIVMVDPICNRFRLQEEDGGVA